ncbi:MFS transporter [Sulfuritalea sp.]|uniref:MFS transporter n=1 Tax=Sulfuritalea sp. TaxID=2480090 RepID=UPI0025D16226|nr:MFS transporter [Sulfuritalea sp.]
MSAAAMPTRQMVAYGALGFPLAFAALPLYVHVPNLYADSVGLPLALVGAVLLLTRFADALIDPLLGQWSDRLGNRRRLILIALPLLGLGLAALLAPPADGGTTWLVLTLALTFIGFSLATINYHAWGAEIGETPQERVRVTAAREMFALGGVVVAAALPSLLAKDVATAMQHLGWVFIPILALAALATFAGAPPANAAAGTTQQGLPLSAVFADPRFRRLLTVLAVGGIASAIPATLVLFFIADVLQLQEWQGLFLVIYFVCGGLALPGWVALARRYGKVRTWLASMVLAIASFVWAFLLGPGDGLAFALICAASGAALGAELALPPALLADLLADGRRKGRAAAGAGAYFGVWNFVNKFNLALAAGIALPLVALFGYKVGAGDTANQGLFALAATYALLPAAIKVVSLLLLWRWQHHFEGRTS